MASSVNINANLNLNPASINASAKQVQQALGRITGQASEFQKSLDASTARVFAFGATTTVINGITQSFKALVSTTINVEAKLKEINSILGAGASEFNKYRNSIFQVAKTTGQSFNTVAEGAAELARQGLGATESAKRLEAALILTRISGLGAEQSVKALTAAMNGFTSAGLSAEQVVNKIVAVDTAFAVSAQDLAEGFSRAGSTAEDAGVSFDQLLGLITAVEQRTARGGAVIGNAFKSIFTRLSRGSTIEDLKDLGVAIDANQNGVQKLKALSDALQNISDPTIASQIKELAGGVFQINVVSAALKDIGNEASVFGKATSASLGASNEATQKNIALNDTLLAKLNSLVATVTSLGEKIGTLTFGPLLESLVGIATSLGEGLDKALDPEKGNKFIQGLFKVIGGFISGPGLAIFTVAFAKIFKTVLKFARDGFKTVMEMGSATERIKSIEGGIVDLLQKDETLREKITSTTASQAQKEQAVIQAIQRENQLLQQQEDLVKSIARQAASRGVRGFDQSRGFTGRRGRRYASGGAGEMEPNLMTAMVNEARDAPPGAMPYVTNFRGKPAVMNTSEMQVRINGREEILREDQIPRFNKGSKFKPKAGGAKGTKIANNKELGDRFVFLTPQVDERSSFGPMTVDKKKHPAIHQVHGIKSSQIKSVSDKEEDSLESKVKKSLFKEAADWTSRIKPLDKSAPISEIEKGFNSIRGAKGALQAAVGSAFEVGISKSLQYEARERDAGGDFDVRGGPNISRIQKLFGIRQTIGDFKNSSSDGNKRSFIRKVRREAGAGAFTDQELKKQAADQAKKRGIPLRASMRQTLSARRASRRGNFAKGSLPNLKLKRFGRGSIPIGPPSQPRAVIRQDQIVDVPEKRRLDLGNLGGGFGLSAAATGMQVAAEKMKKAGDGAASAFTESASSLTSFASTGAALGGLPGAIVGTIVGGISSIFSSLSTIREERKNAREASIPTQNLTEVFEENQKIFGRFKSPGSDPRRGIGTKQIFADLKRAAERTGFSQLNVSKELERASQRLRNASPEKYGEALNNYRKVANKAAKILDKAGTIELELIRQKQIEKSILEFKNNNVGKNLRRNVAEQRQTLDQSSALMAGVQGPFADILQRNIATGQKRAEAADAKGLVEDLKSQLRVAKNPEERERLSSEIDKASENFKQKVIDAAVFMEQKQTEIANLQKAAAEEAAKLQSQAINSAISGIAQGVRGDKINLNQISDFRKDFKAAKTDEERAKLITEFEGMTLAGQSPAMQEALRKAAGLGSGGRRQLIDEAGLRRLEGMSRIEGGTARQRAEFAQYLPSRSGDKRRGELNQRINSLAQQSKDFESQLKEFGQAFGESDVVSSITATANGLRTAAKNTEVLATETKRIADVAVSINELVTNTNSSIAYQNKRITDLEAMLKSESQDTKRTVSELTDK